MGSNERVAKPPVQVVICIEEGRPHQLLSNLLRDTLLEDKRYAGDQIHMMSTAQPAKAVKLVSELAGNGFPVVLVVSPIQIRALGPDVFRRQIREIAGEIQLVAYTNELYWSEDPEVKRVRGMDKDWNYQIKLIVDEMMGGGE